MSRDAVERYTGEGEPPCVAITLKTNEVSPSDLSLPIILTGVREPSNTLLIKRPAEGNIVSPSSPDWALISMMANSVTTNTASTSTIAIFMRFHVAVVTCCKQKLLYHFVATHMPHACYHLCCCCHCYYMFVHITAFIQQIHVAVMLCHALPHVAACCCSKFLILHEHQIQYVLPIAHSRNSITRSS